MTTTTNVCTSRATGTGRSRAFTLIELLVVVSVISILATVLSHGLARMRTRAEGQAPPAVRISQPTPTATAIASEAGVAVRPPILERSDVHVRLAAREELDGYQLYTRYEAEFTGAYCFRNVDESASEIALSFPFPEGMAEARDVSLSFQEADGTMAERPGTLYRLDGIHWSGEVLPGTAVSVLVRYSAAGRDSFVHDLAGEGRIGSAQLSLQLLDAPQPVLPASALQPTSRDENHLVWAYEGLITSRPVIVELPAGTSPLGRLVRLCQLAGLAVLLFGGGFWYLSEGVSPGALDSFGWGHFQLLALTYSSFFGVFAVVGWETGPLTALVTASAVSLPLLTLHVARVLNTHFALSRALPLAIFTLGVVVAGVYLEQGRAMVLAGAAAVVLAYVTITWRGWIAGREARQSALEAERAPDKARQRERVYQEATQGEAARNGRFHCPSCHTGLTATPA